MVLFLGVIWCIEVFRIVSGDFFVMCVVWVDFSFVVLVVVVIVVRVLVIVVLIVFGVILGDFDMRIEFIGVG